MKLPVVDVTVPIVGFYAVAPYLVVLVHFNLLLQLQLLSRKLYAFDTAAPKEEGIGDLRDRLHIFPYTYYLVGRAGPIVRWLGPLVGITLLLLPLATLLVLQLFFLAYQDQTVTWWQRVAIWIDVALVIALWPLIMDRRDSWRKYLSEVGDCLRHHWRIGLALAMVWAGFVLPGFVTTNEVYFTALRVILVLLILLVVSRVLAGLWRRWRGRGRESEGAISAAAPMVRGMPGLLLVVALGVPLPLGLLADGEWWEEELLGANVVASEVVYDRLRFLDLNEQVILAKPAKPELIAQLREGDPQKMEEALKQVERVKLRERSLRGASFAWALLPRADLRGAQLQGANLGFTQLPGADLSGAQLQGAQLANTQLPGANLRGAQLQGASLAFTQLQGADLSGAQLQGASLAFTQLQGADLSGAQLQSAQLGFTQLQGANLSGAQLQSAQLGFTQLQGADLSGAQLQGAQVGSNQLQGADLRSAELYGATFDHNRTALVDLRAARWTPLNAERLGEIREVLGKTIPDPEERDAALEPIETGNAGAPPPILESCLIDPDVTPELNCEQKWLPSEVEAFRGELFPVLEKLACESSAIARDFIRQELPELSLDPLALSDIQDVETDALSSRWGLSGRFAALLGEGGCEGLDSLPKADQNRIRNLARREDKLRAQSSAAKSTKEVPASPTPPPANAPATP